MNAPYEDLTFEKALDELKTIVQILEKGDKPLEESLALFERGVGLLNFCSKKLDEVERRVELLIKDQEGLPFLKKVDEEGDLSV
jgi:exodeoxyribonuclease VII small subunit